MKTRTKQRLSILAIGLLIFGGWYLVVYMGWWRPS